MVVLRVCVGGFCKGRMKVRFLTDGMAGRGRMMVWSGLVAPLFSLSLLRLSERGIVNVCYPGGISLSVCVCECFPRNREVSILVRNVFREGRSRNAAMGGMFRDHTQIEKKKV